MVVVLVVSSEGRICTHIRSVLGSQSWWVTTAADREEALRAAADQQPGLVIVDCEIEGAAELVRTFGAKNGGPGVLLLEPQGEADAFFAFEAGADQILSKPPRAQALLEAAERVMSLPYQSSAANAPEVGEQLSSSDIFGELLMELETTESGSAGSAASSKPAVAAVPVLPGPSEEASAGPNPETEGPEAAPMLQAEEGAEALPSRSEERNAVVAGSDVIAAPPSIEADDGRDTDRGEDGDDASDGDSAVGEAEESSFRFDTRTLGAEVGAIERPASEPPAPEIPALEHPAPELPASKLPASERESVGSDSSDDGEPERPSATAYSERSPADAGRFGQYRLDERIAVGGMAEVWRASMLGLEGFRKTVAIKKILPHLAENDEFVTMFIEEAKLAARLSHENLVEIYDLGKIGESYFIAMEYVDGKDLRGLMNRLRQNSEQMPIGLALLIAAEVARGLDYAHSRKDGDGRPLDLVHRDVSPRNVLIGHDGRVRLCDFGVAKAVSSVIQTQIGALKGKLQYMSPEQASGKAVDHRGDIYSLGSVMYEMISGRRIYEEDNEISLLDAARAGNFDDPRKHCPGLSQEVRGILIKALAKRPAARYQSAGALEEDLRGLLRSLQPPPDSQALGLFVRELFVDRRPAEEAVSAPDIGRASSKPPALAGPSEATRNLVPRRLMTGGKIARFWWGVVAGLLVAGLGAGLISLLSR